MESIAVSDLRTQLMSILGKVERGETMAVTRRGKMIATLTPPLNSKQMAKNELRHCAESAYIGDILSPIEEEWDADK